MNNRNSVLIVDDDSSNIVSLAQILESEYTIYAAKTGLDAIKIAKKNLPTLILLDIVMKDMDGYEVLSVLKSGNDTKNIPVIFVTGLKDKEDEKKGLDLGAADYISKPFSPPIVRLRIRNVIQFLNMIEEVKAKADIEIALHKAEEANKAKSNFLAKMSHEIRTPMNAILGMTEMALREENIDIKNEHIKTVKHAGTDLLSIINDILDFSKIESGKLEYVEKEYHVSSLINDVINIIRMKVSETPLEFIATINNNIPATLIGDEARIRQIIINLLGNAVKYTEEGFISLLVHSQLVDEDTINLIIEVKDSGRGIKNEDIKDLFKDFTQFDLDKNKKIEGVGLGLAITDGLVKTMGGDITVKSEYGKGSAFTVKIKQKFITRDTLAIIDNPKGINALIFETRSMRRNSLIFTIDSLGIDHALISDEFELQKKLSLNTFNYLFISFSLYKNYKDIISRYFNKIKIVVLANFGEQITDANLNVLIMPVYCIPIANLFNNQNNNLTNESNNSFTIGFTACNARVLIVDDVRTNLYVAKGLLMPYNMQIDMCVSGQEAIESVMKKKYDLIFMDHMMPEMNGIETVSYIRKLEGDYFKNVPIIALTAHAIAGTKNLFIENGFNDFISKPIDTVKLNSIIEKWLPDDKKEYSSSR